MSTMERLSEHLKTRIPDLAKLKASGVKIIGYSPGGFMPEELVYAAGAVPLCLARGGDPEPTTESLAYLPRFLDTFCRSQIGYLMLGEEPLYSRGDITILAGRTLDLKGWTGAVKAHFCKNMAVGIWAGLWIMEAA